MCQVFSVALRSLFTLKKFLNAKLAKNDKTSSRKSRRRLKPSAQTRARIKQAGIQNNRLAQNARTIQVQSFDRSMPG